MNDFLKLLHQWAAEKKGGNQVSRALSPGPPWPHERAKNKMTACDVPSRAPWMETMRIKKDYFESLNVTLNVPLLLPVKPSPHRPPTCQAGFL